MRSIKLATFVIIAVLLTALFGVANAGVICQLGDTGSNVRIVQSRLYTLGFLASEPSQPYAFDKNTKTAVAKFQIGSSFDSTGIVDEKTFAAIKLSTAVSYEVYLDKIHTLGSRGEEVADTKTRLKKLGYYNQAINIYYNEAAKQAVTTFQIANNLKATGNAYEATRVVLFSDKAISYAEYRQSASDASLKKGDKGQEVKDMQLSLKSLGYFSNTVSGYYNEKTVTAVKLFESCNALVSDGVADEAMLTLLYSGSAISYDEYQNSLSLIKLSLGDKGEAVVLLQKRLTELYFYDGAISGTFDATVKKSVMRFQNANGINEAGTSNHGVATVATRRVMNSSEVVNRIESEGLLFGDTVPEVANMTSRLKSLGYLTAVYSKYNSYVQSAVALFQTANKLTSTGLADPITLEVIYSDDAISYNESQQSTSAEKIDKMIDIAYKYIGYPYRSPCSVPKSFDCSNYTRFVVKKMGLSIPAEVTAQGKSVAKRFTKILDPGSLRRGDLVYFDTQPGKKPIGHAVIYLGVINGQKSFIHASSSAGKVLVTVFSSWYKERFLFGARIWN